MSITDQLDTQLRAANVAKLDMRRGSVGTSPPQADPRDRGNAPRSTSQPYRVGCAAQVGRLLDDSEAKDEEYLKLKSGEKIKVVRDGACLSNENRKCMPLATRKVG